MLLLHNLTSTAIFHGLTIWHRPAYPTTTTTDFPSSPNRMEASIPREILLTPPILILDTVPFHFSPTMVVRSSRRSALALQHCVSTSSPSQLPGAPELRPPLA